ncbi:MAG: CotH kinase family protein [Polyangiaceae bacterium]
MRLVLPSASLLRTLFLSVLGLSAACGDDDTQTTGGTGGQHPSGGNGGQGGQVEPMCTVDPPSVPVIVAPTSGARDVVEASLTITLDGFSAAAGATFAGADVELYSVKDGVPNNLVWSGAIADSASALSITLAEGTWQNAVTALDPYQDYAVRARFKATDGDCVTTGEFSDYSIFLTDDGSAYLFDPSVVRDIYIDIPPESWDLINAQAGPPGCVPYHRDYYTATLHFEGQDFPGVGLHIKGGCGSARDLNGKASFKINLNWDDPAIPGCPEERRLYGQKHLTLNNGVQDASATHERLAYSIYRQMGVPSARLAHVRVFVNGQLWGLYQHVETYDRRFLERWFGSNKGMLYEGTYWCDLLPQNLPPDGSDNYCLTREFANDVCDTADPTEEPTDYSKLTELVNQIAALPPGGFYDGVKTFFDFDRFLTSWAIESYIAHWDAYEFYIQNNYRVYHDPSTNLWTYLSSGIDQTFGGDLDPWGVGGVLAARCLEEPACEAAFVDKLKLVKQTVASMSLPETATQIHDQIAPYVAEDPRKEYDVGTWESQQQSLQSFLAWRPSSIDQYIVNHGYTP